MSRSSWVSVLLAGSAFVSVGCATTGQAWVQEPENALNLTGAPALEHMASVDRATLSVAHAAEPAPVAADDAPRHRLDHVVSLGESEASAPPPAPNSSAPLGAPGPVVVNIVNYTPPSYGYPIGYVRPYPAAAHRPLGPSSSERVSNVPQRDVPRSATPRTPTREGNWVTPPSHGPSFPFRSAPASPWERAR